MPMTRREFVQRTGVTTAMGLLGGCALHHLPDTSRCKAELPNCTTGHTFENWSHTIQFSPRFFCQPRTEQELIDIVKSARDEGCCVRTQGAGHSFAQLLPTADRLLTLDHLDLGRPIQVDGTRATIPGGMRLKDAIPALRRLGLGFRNLGSVTQQSIAGAFSTGTHGTGLGIGSISTQVLGVRLVTGNGDVHEIGESDARDLAAARINLGALGIITEVTLQCVPDYKLEYNAYFTTFDEVIGRIDELNHEHERVVIWWFVTDFLPRDFVVLITKDPVDSRSHALKGAPDSARFTSGRLKSRDARTLRRAAAPPASGFQRFRHVIENYDQALTIPLLPVFHRECEYAIPVARTAEALRSMRAVVEEGDVSLLLPVELRFVQQDDILLSPSRGRDVCYIGASTLVNSTEVFERFEPLMKSLGGQPHWGKNYTITRQEAQAWYPDTYDTFRAVRDDYDPKRVFANTMLEELFP